MVTGDVADVASGFEDSWLRVWGAGHEADPLSRPDEVVFSESFPEWSDLRFTSFDVHSGSTSGSMKLGRWPKTMENPPKRRTCS